MTKYVIKRGLPEATSDMHGSAVESGIKSPCRGVLFVIWQLAKDLSGTMRFVIVLLLICAFLVIVLFTGAAAKGILLDRFTQSQKSTRLEPWDNLVTGKSPVQKVANHKTVQSAHHGAGSKGAIAVSLVPNQ